MSTSGDRARLIAGGTPVTAINLALRDRTTQQSATPASLRNYIAANRLFVEFVAKRGLTLRSVTNAEFTLFTRALVGESFLDADRVPAVLTGSRSPRTADNLVSLLYSTFSQIEQAYGVAFDWRRYEQIGRRSIRPDSSARRVHRFRTRESRPVGLPDDQFLHLLERAAQRWGDSIVDGDAAYAHDPGAQRGALLSRNVAILHLLRYGGARRNEVPPLDLDDIDRPGHRVLLVTKGRFGGKEPVVLLPVLEQVLFGYILHHRPYGDRLTRPGHRQPSKSVDRQAVFLSHSVNGYGQRISGEAVRAVVDVLRPALDRPWREAMHPHLLRHAWGYDLQKHAGPVAQTANMRHASPASMSDYWAGPEAWQAELASVDETARALLKAAGIA